MRRSTAGFTLLETLVALAILAVALGAAYRAMGMSTTTATGLHLRMLADWVAQDRVALWRMSARPLVSGVETGTVVQAGQTLGWRETVRPGPGPAWRQLQVEVWDPDHPDARLSVLQVRLPLKGTP